MNPIVNLNGSSRHSLIEARKKARIAIMERNGCDARHGTPWP
jgi:hypothetical protein